jgi:hypothetical protein
VVRVERAEGLDLLEVLDRVVLGDLERAARPLDHLVDVLEQLVALLDGEVLVDAAGDRAGAVDLLAGRGLDDLLAVLAHHHALHRQVGVLGGDADDVADRRVGIEAEQQVRASTGGRSAARATGTSARSASAGASSPPSA